MDWPAGQLDRMSAVLNVYNQMSTYASGKGDASWMDANPGIARTVANVIKWRMSK